MATREKTYWIPASSLSREVSFGKSQASWIPEVLVEVISVADSAGTSASGVTKAATVTVVRAASRICSNWWCWSVWQW